MPPTRKEQLDKNAWSWAELDDPNTISNDNIECAYRVKLPRCKLLSCRRNCRGNPHCLSGLGENRWLGENRPEELATELEDPEIERRKPDTFVGLKNLGATCYVNSLLQLWFHNKAFRHTILHWNPLDDPEECVNPTLICDTGDATVPFSPQSVVAQLQALFTLMQCGNKQTVDPTAFIHVLGLDTHTQQDAQEFSTLFFSLLENHLSHQSSPSVSGFIYNNFRGENSCVTKCSKCKKESVRPSVFYELELNVRDQLSESLAEFLQEEKLEGADKYSCMNCDEKQEAIRSIRLCSLPPVLNLQLKRFLYDRQKARKIKLTSYLQFPETLDMSKYVPGQTEPLLYNLSAVLVHLGPSAYSGHYVAYICDKISGTWYKFNDESVEKMEGKKLALGAEEDCEEGSKKVKCPRSAKGTLTSKNAYMLVYTKVGWESDDKQPANPTTELTLLPHLQRYVMHKNTDFFNWVSEVNKTRDNCLANGRERHADMASLCLSLPVDQEADSEWEAISSDWLSYWLNNDKATVKPVDNSGLLCVHNKLNPMMVPNAKYISTSAGSILYERCGGGPRLVGAAAECPKCVESKAWELRMKTRSAEDAKDIANLLKFKIDPGMPGFWVGKKSMKSWRRKVVDMWEKSGGTLSTVRCQVQNNINMNKHTDEENCNDEGSPIMPSGSPQPTLKTPKKSPIFEKSPLKSKKSPSCLSLNSHRKNLASLRAFRRKKSTASNFADKRTPERKSHGRERGDSLHEETGIYLQASTLADLRECFVLCQKLSSKLQNLFTQNALNYVKSPRGTPLSPLKRRNLHRKTKGCHRIITQSESDNCESVVSDVDRGLSEEALSVIYDSTVTLSKKMDTSCDDAKVGVSNGPCKLEVSGSEGKLLEVEKEKGQGTKRKAENGDLDSWEDRKGDADVIVAWASTPKTEEDDEASEAFNEDITCCHGNLTINEASRRLVSKPVWDIFYKYFPFAKVFTENSQPCDECESLEMEGRMAKDMYRKKANEEKERLGDLFADRNRPHWDEPHQPGNLHLIAKEEFVDPWRRFVKEAGRREPLYSLRNEALFCQHSLLLYNPLSESDAARFVVVSDEEWNVLSMCYSPDTDVQISRDPVTKVIQTVPEVCNPCLIERLEREQRELLQYDRAKVFIRLATVSSSQGPEEPDSASSNAMEPPGTAYVPSYVSKKARLVNGTGTALQEAIRRSSRQRKERGEKAITVSSDTTLRDLKLKILQQFEVAPFDQHLQTLDGRDLTSNTSTLSSLNIMPNSVILLKVDEPREGSTSPIDDFLKTSEPEAGFKGTELLKR